MAIIPLTAKTPASSRTTLLDNILSCTDYYVKLFTNEVDENNPEFTEASFLGYDQVKLDKDNWNASVIESGLAVSYYKYPVFWVSTNVLNVIYGFYVVDDSNTVIFYQKFSDPVILSKDKGLNIVPKIILGCSPITPTPTPTPTVNFNAILTADTFNDIGLPCNPDIFGVPVICPEEALFTPDCCGLTGLFEYIAHSAIAGVNFQSIEQGSQLKFNADSDLDSSPEVQAVFEVSGQYIGSTSFEPKYIGQPLVVVYNNNNYYGIFDSNLINLTPTVTPTCFVCDIDVNTPAGLNVQVEVVPQVGGLVGLSIIFAEVTFEGTTTVDFQIGNIAGAGESIFEWNTDAQHSGDLAFAFKLPDMISESDFANFFVFSIDSGAITEITIKDGNYTPDYASRTIYGLAPAISSSFISLGDTPQTHGIIGVDSCPIATFNGSPVSGSANSGNCLYEVTCYKCNECPNGRTRQLSFGQIDGKSCSDFGYISSCEGLAWCDAKQICIPECTGVKTFNNNCDCVCPIATFNGSTVSGSDGSGNCLYEVTCYKCDECPNGRTRQLSFGQTDGKSCSDFGQYVSACGTGSLAWCDAQQICITECTGGREFNNNCECVCPSFGSFEFDWCDEQGICTTKCTGGKIYNNDCQCVCPEGEEWCMGQERCNPKCPGEKEFNENCGCVCPDDYPLECPSDHTCRSCTGGRILDEDCDCICESFGVFEFDWCPQKEICTTKCTGGKIYNNDCECVCPEGQDFCNAMQMCVGECTDVGKIYNDNCLCVCPDDYPLECPSDQTCYSCETGEILDENCECTYMPFMFVSEESIEW